MSEGRQDSQDAPGDRQIPQVGEVLCGVYRLDRLLGWGAVGIVYAAWHMELRRACAIKILHPNFVEHRDVRERFRREALSAFKLKHPHIIRVLDYREDESGWPVMVMELLYGESLRQRLARGPLSLPVVEKLFAQLCDAIAMAHRHGIVHRDLKPENIFLSRLAQDSGPESEVGKILDFGISKITDHPEITAMHVLLGSPSYMSPEQARGDARTVDPRADIFSLGLILFECLTGRKAFVAADPEEKRRLILEGAVPSLREVSPELPWDLDTVIHKASAVRPEDRFQSSIEMLEALRKALRDGREQRAPRYSDPRQTVVRSSLPPSARSPTPPVPLSSAEETVLVQSPRAEARPISSPPAPLVPSVQSAQSAQLAPSPPPARQAPSPPPVSPAPDPVDDLPIFAGPSSPTVLVDLPISGSGHAGARMEPAPRGHEPSPRPAPPPSSSGSGSIPVPGPGFNPGPGPGFNSGPGPGFNSGPGPGPGFNPDPVPGPGSNPGPGPGPVPVPGPGPGSNPGSGLQEHTEQTAQDAPKAEDAAPQRPPLLERILTELARRLGRFPAAADVLRRLIVLTRGREIVFIGPLVFLLVLGMLAIIDWQCNQPVTSGHPTLIPGRRMEVIDGPH